MTPTHAATTPTTTGARRAGTSRRTLAAALAGLVLVAAPGVASASTDDGGADPRPRVERACLRIPNLQIRTDRLLERLRADAETRGSLAWIEVQIERARDRGRDDLVVVLENRLAVRTATVPVLEQRADELDRLAERCAELGVDL